MPRRPAIDLVAIRDRHPQHFARFDRQRLLTLLTGIAAFALLLFGMGQLGFFGGTLLSGSMRLVEIVGLMLPPDPGSWAHARTFGVALLETVAIAFLGTLSAAVLALPVAMLAARNVTAQRVVRFFSRRSLDTIRSVDILVWALIWINVVGLGPFAGALAIMTGDIGSFGKLFSEAMEAADRTPVQGIVSTGGGHALASASASCPRSFPCWRARSCTISIEHPLGQHHRHRGAGGIGHLAEAIRTLELQQTSFIIVLILIAVALIDFVSSKLRFAMIGRRGAVIERRGRGAPRYALYYAPRPGGLAVTAASGSAAIRNRQTRALRPVPGIAMDRLVEITAEPRLYGFHGTLKAPIALVDGASERDFLDAVGRFAASDRTFAIPALELAEISGFRPRAGGALRRTADLADRCVVEFDEFRRPAESRNWRAGAAPA
jgi:phosphonate transport system permease protein